MTNSNYLIEVSDLHKSFGELKVLKGVSEHVSKGEVVSIIGPSGGGKSTFLRCLNLLEVPDSGKILFEGVDITAKGVNIDLHRQKMGMVFQHFNVFPHMTVGENVTMAPVLLGKKKQNEADEMAKELLNRVGLLESLTNIRSGFRAARSSVLPSCGRWRWSRTSCCLTSRPRRWTRRWSARYWRSSRGWSKRV